uniref:Endoplasmic reticulum lectin n=1 Tax=Apteryx owenii TaxID=8824 RepID=A0A8B9PFA0_APTOW
PPSPAAQYGLPAPAPAAYLVPGRTPGFPGLSLRHEERWQQRRGLVLPAPAPPPRTPVDALPQRQAEDVVTVASKFKQRYECRLPPAAVRRQPDPEEEAQLYNGSGIAELLRPMGAAPCLVKTKDWWTYEFCYGKHIQQYHVEARSLPPGLQAAPAEAVPQPELRERLPV